MSVLPMIWSRLHQHVKGLTKGFTYRYNCNYLIYYERHDDINNAIAREKEIKGWSKQLALFHNCYGC